MIVPMLRLEIVCLSDIRTALVVFLQERGLVHMEDVPVEVETDDGTEASALVDKMTLPQDELAAFTRAEELERTLNEVLPLLSERPDAEALRSAGAAVASWSEEDLAEKVSGWADRLRGDTREKLKLLDTIDVLNSYQAILEQLAPALGADVRLGRGTRALVLSGNVDSAVENLQRRFGEEIGGGYSFHRNRISRRSLVGLLTFPEDQEETISRILSQEGIAPVDLREEDMEDVTVQEVLSNLRTTLQNHHTRLAELNGSLKEISSEAGASLAAAPRVVADRLGQFRVQRSFAQTQMLTVMHGWIPEGQLPDLRRAADSAFADQVAISELDHKDVPHHLIPTQLHNPSLFAPFELVLKLFNPPTYGSLDPTILVGVSFTIFYGFIVGDVFYGLAIMAFASWLGRKFKHVPEMADVKKIGIYMGISTIVFGVLFGEYGGEWTHIPPIWMHRDPGDPIRLMIWALYFGMAHMTLALSLGVYENWRHHHINHALEKAGMLLGLFTLIIIGNAYFGVAPFDSTPVLALGGVLFLVAVALLFKSMGMMGLIGVLEILSLGGNVISYARLMALGVAAVAIAGIANDLPGQLGPLIGVPMAVLVHLANIGISIASPTIHAMRLNVVEFLPKFFEPAGRGYAPFKKEIQS